LIWDTASQLWVMKYIYKKFPLLGNFRFYYSAIGCLLPKSVSWVSSCNRNSEHRFSIIVFCLKSWVDYYLLINTHCQELMKPVWVVFIQSFVTDFYSFLIKVKSWTHCVIYLIAMESFLFCNLIKRWCNISSHFQQKFINSDGLGLQTITRWRRRCGWQRGQQRQFVKNGMKQGLWSRCSLWVADLIPYTLGYGHLPPCVSNPKQFPHLHFGPPFSLLKMNVY
jgi:hypothetical protein